MNTNLSRYRSQSLQVLFDDAQGDTSQDSRIYKLQKEEFRNCLVRLIERQARPIETRTYRILFQPKFNLMYQVSSKTLLVYKGNFKHVFSRLFRERIVCLLLVLFLEKSQDLVLQKLLPSLVIKGADDLNLQRWSWSYKQESLCC